MYENGKRKRTREQWASRALAIALSKADKKTDLVEKIATYERGIKTAMLWLSGNHPKDSVAVIR